MSIETPQIDIESVIFNEFSEFISKAKPDPQTGTVDLYQIAEHAVYAVSGSPMYKNKINGHESELAKNCVKTALELLQNN